MSEEMIICPVCDTFIGKDNLDICPCCGHNLKTGHVEEDINS